eukprot:TRINITY_DN11354_c0_g1_i1.p1 TRINITY_DN11354_c0_g1~~TRINITY_DN11354_c0_g1_i1.p1  ORF type:complete len:443 (-),score=53.80 TRINITY_DN11354_c0_g1_i1:104-1432(-)
MPTKGPSPIYQLWNDTDRDPSSTTPTRSESLSRPSSAIQRTSNIVSKGNNNATSDDNGKGRLRTSWISQPYVKVLLFLCVVVILGLVVAHVYDDPNGFKRTSLGIWFTGFQQVASQECVVSPSLSRSSPCFDIGRCGSSRLDFKFYMYPPTAHDYHISKLYRTILGTFERRPEWTTDPNEACLLIPRLDTTCVFANCLKKDAYPFGRYRVTQELRKLPHWNQGRNHLVFEFHDHSFLEYEADYAMAIKSSYSDEFYRPGFDISIPTYPANTSGHHFSNEVRSRSVADRTTFAFFKGSFTHWVRRRLIQKVHNGKDIIAVHAKDPRYDFKSTMADTQFALVPRGNGLHTYRLIEAMSAGCIPVLLCDGYVLPFGDKVPWSSFTIQIPEEKFREVPNILHAIPMSEMRRMQREAILAYETFFKSWDVMIGVTLEIMKDRVYGPQ